jgi:hypothetical protein
MILDLLNKRYSARTFTNKSIEQEKIDYVINCAYTAPSKQCNYPWTLYVLDESPTSKEFKEWLFWEDTWCVDSERAQEKDRNSNNKRFNGQYRAPLLLMWALRGTGPNPMWSDIMDITVSASFAMLAAEELELKTCFGACHSISYKNTALGKEEVNVVLSVGIGYAEEDNTIPMVFPIEKDSILQGYETKNLNQDYPIEHHTRRGRKPSKDQLIKYIK